MIRIKHGLSLEEAQELVDNLSVRILPDVWDVAGRKVVLDNSLSMNQKTLLLMYASQEEALFVDDLYKWTKYSELSKFKKNIILPLDKHNLILYDKENDLVYLSPKGAQEVEKTLL